MSSLPSTCLALVLLLASSLAGATAPSQQYQQLRSQATLLTVNALIYYDAEPQARPDKRHLTALQDAQQRLEALARELNVSSASLDAWLDKLQALSRDEAPRYPQLLIGLLDSRAQLDREAAAAYQQAQAQLPQATRLLNRQSLDIASLLLHAQARSARVIGDHSLLFAEAEFVAQDQAIKQGFAELTRLLPAQADTLHQQLLAYRFVRKRLLDRDPGQVIGGLERYLAGVVVALDALAATNPSE